MAEDKERKDEKKEEEPLATKNKSSSAQKKPVKRKTKKLVVKKKEGEAEKPEKKAEEIKAEKEEKKIEPEEGEKGEKPIKKAEKKEEPEKKKKVEEEKEGEKAEEEEIEEGEEEEEVEEEEEREEIEIIEEEEEYKVKIKPELSDKVKRGLKVRSSIKKKTPDFKRQEWFRYRRLGTVWRKPRGLHSKMRKHKGYRLNVVSIGYGSPAITRNLHPSGFKEVMVYNVSDLDKIDPKSQAARVGHGVGTRKRIDIEEKAEEKGIRVLNPRRL